MTLYRYLLVVRHILIASFLMMPVACAYADNDTDWEAYLQELCENSDEGAAAFETAYEHLTELQAEPLDVNTAEVAQLLQIPGLDLNVINDIIEYREKYGHLKSITELALIPSIDNRLRTFLSSFLVVGEAERLPWYSREQLQKSLKHLKHTVLLSASIPTYYRAGDTGMSSVNGNRYAGAYLGDPVKHSLRYSVKMGSHATLNVTGGKTAGEPFGTDGNGMGYDTYSFNVSANRIGHFNRIIIGHFRAQFGMGLTVNNSFTMGRQAMLSSVGRLTSAFTPHGSAGDGRHFQGIAASVDFSKRLQLSAFASCQYLDATLNADSSSVSSLLYSPQHRTRSEMAKKHNTMQTDLAAHLRYLSPLTAKVQWSIGVSLAYTAFSRTLNPTFSPADTVSASRLYRLHHPHGTRFWNVAADYSLRWRTLTLSGETALNDQGAIATVNTASWRTAQRLTLSAVQRYYAYQYYALNGSSFSSGNSVHNESGLYLAARYLPSARITIEAYTDIAYYPWLRYRVSGSSYSWDNCLSATLSHREWTLALRYRANSRQRDVTANGAKRLAWRTDQKLRLTATYQTDRLSLRMQTEGCCLTFDNHSSGIIASLQSGYAFAPQWRAYAMGAYFHTDDYDSRLYAYERSILNNPSFTSYYGHGLRLALMLRTDLSSHIMATVKAGHTHYFDRESIGTAERTIYSNHQTDIDLQVRVKF